MISETINEAVQDLREVLFSEIRSALENETEDRRADVDVLLPATVFHGGDQAVDVRIEVIYIEPDDGEITVAGKDSDGQPFSEELQLYSVQEILSIVDSMDI